MTPKEYFVKNFENAIMKPLDSVVKKIEEFFPDLNVFNTLRTNFPYSNDYSFNLVIKSLKEKSSYRVSDSIYVGKLGNRMPNCYTVNSAEIDGCLICYTTGMTENTNLFAQVLVALFMGESLGVNKEIAGLYANLLTMELERRIHDEYGGKITTNIFVDMGIEWLEKDRIIEIVAKGSNYSAVMDTILVFHEYAHYVIRTFTSSKDIGVKTLVLMTADLYAHLCEETPEMAKLPMNEIQADLMALLLLSNGIDLELMEIISVFAAFLQLNRMSENDEYTNKHRLNVIHFFFKNSKTYQENKDSSIKQSIELIRSIFANASPEVYNKESYSRQMVNTMKVIYSLSSLSEAKKMRIFKYYAGLKARELEREINNKQDRDSSDFEDL